MSSDTVYTYTVDWGVRYIVPENQSVWIAWSEDNGWEIWPDSLMPYEDFLAIAKSGQRLHEFKDDVCLGCGLTKYVSVLTKNLFCPSPVLPPPGPIEIPAEVIKRAFSPPRRR